jgi:hypothetical protein
VYRNERAKVGAREELLHGRAALAGERERLGNVRKAIHCEQGRFSWFAPPDTKKNGTPRASPPQTTQSYSCFAVCFEPEID